MGLAPLIVAELYELVGQLAAQGMTILLVEQFVTTALSVATGRPSWCTAGSSRRARPAEMADAALGVYLA